MQRSKRNLLFEIRAIFHNLRRQAQSLHESSEQREGDFHVLDT
jgi:hypothetical protein